MTIVTINKRAEAVSFALFESGFRPFFLAAPLFSVLSLALWMLVYFGHAPVPFSEITTFQWHAHEMVFGYTMAVIAGFLLTAVHNWTGVQTLRRWPLGVLVGMWAAARILFASGLAPVALTATIDLAFMVSLLVSIAAPVVRMRQWRQAGIIAKVLLLTVCNGCFYLGALGLFPQGTTWGLYGGLFLIVGLILTITSRVLPRFIRNSVGYEVELPNPPWLSVGSLAFFVGFAVNHLFIQSREASAVTSTAMMVIVSAKLFLWHTRGIWRNPLLWSLYLSLAFIALGFLLFFLNAVGDTSPLLAVHAFAYGGIGLATLGMMSRVVLGHTGRNVRVPPPGTKYALLALTAGAVVRILFPLMAPGSYGAWILLSQLVWTAAFLLFLAQYSTFLIGSRIDGNAG